MIAGNGLYMLDAVDAQGAEPSGWPKLTGGWSIGTPGVGDWDGDGHLEVAQQRRDGELLVWHTAGTTPAQWGSYGCDAYNSGACVDTVRGEGDSAHDHDDDRRADDHERGVADLAGGGGHGRIGRRHAPAHRCGQRRARCSSPPR